MNQKINAIRISPGVSITHNSRNVTTIYFDHVREGWEQWFLLSSDRHHDSPHCDRELELEHLEKAQKRNAYILDYGDLFDVMQGRYDPRRSYKDLRPEYKGDNLLDLIVEDAARFFQPYARLFLVIGRGNHDQKIIQNNGVDLVSNLVHRLNVDGGGHVQAGGYGGWVRFCFTMQKTHRISKRLKYFHGAGGGGPVTRDVIKTNRMAVYLPDADFVCTGHTHDSFIVPIARERISDAGAVYQDIQYHIKTTTYKSEYQDGSDGWHVETGKPPKPLGAAWLRFYYERNGVEVDIMPDVK